MSTLQDQFAAFAKFGDTKSDGKGITLYQADKWLKQAGVTDGKKVTTIDTGICFNKFRSQKIGYQDFVKFVEDLASTKKLDSNDMKQKLINCGLPSATNILQSPKSGSERLTSENYGSATPNRYQNHKDDESDDSGRNRSKEEKCSNEERSEQKKKSQERDQEGQQKKKGNDTGKNRSKEEKV